MCRRQRVGMTLQGLGVVTRCLPLGTTQTGRLPLPPSRIPTRAPSAHMLGNPMPERLFVSPRRLIDSTPGCDAVHWPPPSQPRLAHAARPLTPLEIVAACPFHPLSLAQPVLLALLALLALVNLFDSSTLLHLHLHLRPPSPPLSAAPDRLQPSPPRRRRPPPPPHRTTPPHSTTPLHSSPAVPPLRNLPRQPTRLRPLRRNSRPSIPFVSPP
ncbi:uncharacterized protein J3D65DRAFT_339061 [Phyllosticta citribraziliensis]|uniref:Uncharacterized protein n=1 Tax=Phyllosticta citribraziliensis TaxID=989973 RepID=A0ABR1LU01_9PEZI